MMRTGTLQDRHHVLRLVALVARERMEKKGMEGNRKLISILDYHTKRDTTVNVH